MALAAQGLLANHVMGQRAPERMDEEVIGAFRWLDAGEQIRVYETGPENASSAVLLVHDWFGVSEMSIEAAERLGSMGYRVVAVDLYDGESATDHAGAGALMGGLVRQRTNLILRTAAALASEGGRPLYQGGDNLNPEATRLTWILVDDFLERHLR